jgi:hypothetical protein
MTKTTAFLIYFTGVLLIAAPFIIDTIKQEKRLAKKGLR